METPLSLSCWIFLKSSSTSPWDRAAVGSSRMSTLVLSNDMARAISTICALPMVRVESLSVGRTPISNSRIRASVFRLIVRSEQKNPLDSRPIKRFCATVSSFIMFSS